MLPDRTTGDGSRSRDPPSHLPTDARRACDSDIDERMQLYLGIFSLFWLCVMLRHGVQRATAGQLAGWTINELPANVRLQRYLARALAWPDSDCVPTAVEFFPG